MDNFCLENGFIDWYVTVFVVDFFYIVFMLLFVYRFETSAKEDKGISAAAKYLIDTVLQLETEENSDNEYEVDYSTNSSSSSIITLNDESYRHDNKSDTSKCCT